MLRRSRQYNHHITQTQTRYHGLLFALLASFLAGFLISYNSEFIGKVWTHSIRSILKASVFQSNPDSGSSSTPFDTKKSTLQLIGELSRARYNMEADLIADYGEFYGLLFDRIALESTFRINPLSKDRLLRRMMQKILEARRNQDKLRQQQQVEKTTKKKKMTATFTWVTAGDSRAAAHGNIFSQSYTSVMDVSTLLLFY